MRQETLWQGERRAARMHWWRQVLDRPATAEVEALFDEVLSVYFSPALERDGLGGLESASAGQHCWR